MTIAAAVGPIWAVEVFTLVVEFGGITTSVATADGSGVALSLGSTVAVARGSEANTSTGSTVITSAD
jgi:hypothetical protein